MRPVVKTGAIRSPFPQEAEHRPLECIPNNFTKKVKTSCISAVYNQLPHGNQHRRQICPVCSFPLQNSGKVVVL